MEINYSGLKIPCQFLASFKYVEPYCAGKRVLDIGCASGEYLRIFSKESVGIDMSLPNIDEALNNGLNVKRVNINDELPFPNDEFDVVFCSHVLEHVNSPLYLLKESNRVLKKDGLIIIGLPTEKSLARVLNDHYFKDHEGHIYAFTLENIKRLVEYSGFKYEKCVIDINWVRKLYLWWLLWFVQKLPCFLTMWWSNAYWVIGKKSNEKIK